MRQVQPAPRLSGLLGLPRAVFLKTCFGGADAGALTGQLCEQLPLNRAQIGSEKQPAEDSYGLGLRAGQNRRLDGRMIVAQGVGAAAMRERVDIHAVAADLDDRAVPPIANAFDRVGERLTIEAIGITKDIRDGHGAEIGIVKLNDDARPQHAVAPLLYRTPRFVAIYAARNC